MVKGIADFDWVCSRQLCIGQHIPYRWRFANRSRGDGNIDCKSSFLDVSFLQAR